MKKSSIFVLSLLFIAALALLGNSYILRFFTKDSPKQTFGAAVTAETAAFTPQTEVPTVQGKPVSINIPSLNLTVAITDGIYYEKSRTWSLSNTQAHYALMTPPVNNKNGNTFIYGHNRKGVFNTLSKMQLGDRAIVTTDNGHKFVYQLKQTLETDPYDDSLFRYQGPPILTLQTCSGRWYQNRQLFTFDLVEVQ